MKFNEGNPEPAMVKLKSLREVLSKLAGYDVGEPQPAFFLSKTVRNCLMVSRNSVAEEAISFPPNVAMKQVKVLFKIPMPITTAKIVRAKNLEILILSITGLN